MKERPIIFPSPMIKALLENRKSQTRQVVKPQPPEQIDSVHCPNLESPPQWWDFYEFGQPGGIHRMKSPYRAGLRLWVRETWKYSTIGNKSYVRYGADDSRIRVEHDLTRHIAMWRPPSSMPRWASRITLEVVNVRVERLKNISKGDARAEGAQFVDFGKDRWGNQLPGWRCDKLPERWQESLGSARFAFANLWDTINRKYPWVSNPWVFAISFGQYSLV